MEDLGTIGDAKDVEDATEMDDIINAEDTGIIDEVTGATGKGGGKA